MFECRTGLDPVFQLGLLVVWGVVLRLFGEKKTKRILNSTLGAHDKGASTGTHTHTLGN